MSKVKPVKNKRKNLQSFPAIRLVEKDVLPSDKL